MDLNHDKVIQSHLCYRYTIGQAGASGKLKSFAVQSRRHTAPVVAALGERRQFAVPQGRKTIAHGFNRGFSVRMAQVPQGRLKGLDPELPPTHADSAVPAGLGIFPD